MYGGAITLEMPQGMVDVSGFRQVPDHQEVFVSKDGDQSMIVEILEQQPGASSSQEALRFHYREVTEIAQSELMDIPVTELSNPSNACLMAGQQPMAKFNETSTADVWILMALIQVPHRQADILVTWNIPSNYSQQLLEQFISYLSTFRINDHSLFLSQ